MSELFYWILNMSIVSSVTGLLVIFVRKLLKIPRRASLFLWIIPFLRMTLPFGIKSNFSFLNFISSFRSVNFPNQYELQYIPDASYTNCIVGANSYFPIKYKTNYIEEFFSVSSVIWLFVFIAIIFVLIVIYMSSNIKSSNLKKYKDNIYFSNQTALPYIYGIFKPKIIIPQSYLNMDLELIILHEKIHIKRHDNLIRMIAIFITALHWFNPIAHFILYEFLEDLEMSCDEILLKRVGTHRAKEYATVLLETKINKSILVSSLGSPKIKKRIQNILSFKKISFTYTVFIVVFFLAVFIILLTNSI